MPMIVLTEDQVRQALDPAMLIKALESAFVVAGGPSLQMPLRSLMQTTGGIAVVMPCCDGGNWAGVKLAHVSRSGNVEASYLLLDGETGKVAAMMGANELTALRTAATSALATNKLARQDARVLGIFGTGREARAHA